MTKSASSGFAGLVVIVVLAVVILLAGVYSVINNRNDSEQQEQANNTKITSQTDADKPLGTAVSNIANDIEKELDALAEDDYSDSGLSDTALYE